MQIDNCESKAQAVPRGLSRIHAENRISHESFDMTHTGAYDCGKSCHSELPDTCGACHHEMIDRLHGAVCTACVDIFVYTSSGFPHEHYEA